MIVSYKISVMIMSDLPFLLSCCTIVSYLDPTKII